MVFMTEMLRSCTIAQLRNRYEKRNADCRVNKIRFRHSQRALSKADGSETCPFDILRADPRTVEGQKPALSSVEGSKIAHCQIAAPAWIIKNSKSDDSSA